MQRLISGFLWCVVMLLTLFSSRVEAASLQPYFDRAMANIHEFRLDNGMTFIVMERHQAPVVSFVTYVNVGGSEEDAGKTGTAHFLEHLAFKGTRRIGSSDERSEQKALARLDQIFDQLQAAKAAQQPTEALQQRFEQARVAASRYVRRNEFGQIVEQAGGVGLNASTSLDATRYFYSFPANKLELWMSLESERFLEPVFREFFEEKAVVLEEQLRQENMPISRMIEAMQAEAFRIHPYGRPAIGRVPDIESLARRDVEQFFQRYYVPSNLTMAVVGDVDPDQVRGLAQTYFGRYPARPVPLTTPPVEPPQTAPRQVELRLPTQPWYLEGYHRPASTDPDDIVYRVLTGILSRGRTSRLYQALVEPGLALNAQGSNGFPGDRYPNLLLIYALTAPGKTIDQVAATLQREILRLAQEPVTEQELDRVKTQARAGLLRGLDSNSGLAGSLAEFQGKTGDWRNLFRRIQALDAVTAADVQRVAQQTFRSENRIVGRLLSQ